MDAEEKTHSTDWMMLPVHGGAAMHCEPALPELSFREGFPETVFCTRQGPASGVCREQGLEHHSRPRAAGGSGCDRHDTPGTTQMAERCQDMVALGTRAGCSFWPWEAMPGR